MEIKQNKKPLIPPVIWAQRSHMIYITFCVEDCINPDVKIGKKQLSFRSVAGVEKKTYEIKIPLYAVIDSINSAVLYDGRYVEVELQKLLSDTKYWPRLTEDNVKHHWLKVNFLKWVDEEEDDMNDATSSTQNFKNVQPSNMITFSLGDIEDDINHFDAEKLEGMPSLKSED